MISIILADDDAIVLQGLQTILASFADIALLGVASNGQDAVELCRRRKPDVAVLDIRMPQMDGIAAAAAIIQDKLASPLLLTTFDEPELIARALEVGARGYVLKNSPLDQIHSAIVSVAAGGTVFSPDILDFIRTQVHLPSDDVFGTLTQRELEIVALIAEGLSNEQIAQRLFIANGTVRNHISTILEKTALDHRTQIAVRYYIN